MEVYRDAKNAARQGDAATMVNLLGEVFVEHNKLAVPRVPRRTTADKDITMVIKQYSCNYCGKKFQEQDTMAHHIRRLHKMDYTQPVCTHKFCMCIVLYISLKV